MWQTVQSFLGKLEAGTWTQAAGALATLAVVLVALFKDGLVRWRRRPVLCLEFQVAPPSCAKVTLRSLWQSNYSSVSPPAPPATDCYIFRVKVANAGRTRAEHVQVYVKGVSRRQASGQFVPVQSFLPMNLQWTHEKDVFTRGISPKMSELCELGRAIDPQNRKPWGDDLADVPANESILALSLEVAAGDARLLKKGEYKIDVRLAASNCAPKDETIHLRITGDWFADQDKMFAEGLAGELL